MAWWCMAFNTFAFLLFFALVAGVNFLLPARLRWGWLLAASLVFYGWAGPVYLIQILLAAFLSYAAALRMEAETDKARKKHILTLIVLALVGNLFAFKYVGFVNETLRSLAGLAHADYPFGVVDILAPLGISFYSFQLISYVVDVYRGAPAERHAGLFALYTTLFPKVISGPIERGKNLLPQLHAIPGFDHVRVAAGLQLVAWGAFKKIVVADRIAPLVDRVYDSPQAHEGIAMVAATFLYAFQLYCDFSGYTDMALGAGAILGFRLMRNFNRPYFATSIPDFWRRWHISLTSWLTDYVYTPLTRIKIGIKWYRMMLLSLFLTFVLSGIWHGAAWTFVLWGALHGGYVVAATQLQKPYNKFARRIGLIRRPDFHRRLKIVTTFTLVCIAYVIFRARTLPDAIYIYTHLHTGWGTAVSSLRDSFPFDQLVYSFAGIAVVLLVEIVEGDPARAARVVALPIWRWGLRFGMISAIFTLGAFYGTGQQFIYFRF